MFGNKYFILNYEIINEKFENNKVWVVIFKFSTLITLKIIVKFDPNSNLKFFYLPNNKFELILNFQIKSSFPNMILHDLRLKGLWLVLLV